MADAPTGGNLNNRKNVLGDPAQVAKGFDRSLKTE
jgi:hypothetical protein